jgi:hypothetical protein
MPFARWLRLCGPHGECVAWPRYRTFAGSRLMPLTTPECAPRGLEERRPLCRGRTSMDCGATWRLPHLPTAADCGSSFLSRRSARSATRYVPTSNLVWRKRQPSSRTQADPRVPCSAIPSALFRAIRRNAIASTCRRCAGSGFVPVRPRFFFRRRRQRVRRNTKVQIALSGSAALPCPRS